MLRLSNLSKKRVRQTIILFFRCVMENKNMVKLWTRDFEILLHSSASSIFIIWVLYICILLL